MNRLGFFQAHWTDLLTDPRLDELSYPQPGRCQLLRVAGTVRVHVGTVGGPGDVDGGGQLVEVLQDPHGVPGVDAAVDEDHVADTGLEAPVLNVSVGHIVGQHVVVEILSESIHAPALEEVQRQGAAVDSALLWDRISSK